MTFTNEDNITHTLTDPEEVLTSTLNHEPILQVEIMGLRRTNNGRCKNKCGKTIREGDVIAFEDAVVKYRGPTESSIGVIKVNKFEERCCCLAFVRPSDYGGFDAVQGIE